MTVLVEWVALLRPLEAVSLGLAETRPDALARAVELYGRRLVDVRSRLSWDESLREQSARARNQRLGIRDEPLEEMQLIEVEEMG